MGYKLVGFLEGSFVEQEINSLARREFSLLMLPCPSLWPAALYR